MRESKGNQVDFDGFANGGRAAAGHRPVKGASERKIWVVSAIMAAASVIRYANERRTVCK